MFLALSKKDDEDVRSHFVSIREPEGFCHVSASCCHLHGVHRTDLGDSYDAGFHCQRQRAEETRRISGKILYYLYAFSVVQPQTFISVVCYDVE